MVMTPNNNINTSKITIFSFEIKIFSHILDTSNLIQWQHFYVFLLLSKLSTECKVIRRTNVKYTKISLIKGIIRSKILKNYHWVKYKDQRFHLSPQTFCLKWNFVMSDFIWIITSCNIYLNNWVVILNQLDIGLKGIVYIWIIQLLAYTM